MTLHVISARQGRAIRLRKDEHIKLINTHGKQVIDTWAFNAHDLTEYMSMSHTRAYLNKIIPCVNDTLVTQQRSHILTMVEDTTPGHHDTLMPACDRHRYAKQYGLKDYHDNCSDNLANALVSIGLKRQRHAEREELATPDPFNVFMHIPVRHGNTVSWEPSTAEEGQYVVFRAEMDVIVVFSACPNDVMPINGGLSREAHFQIY